MFGMLNIDYCFEDIHKIEVYYLRFEDRCNLLRLHNLWYLWYLQVFVFAHIDLKFGFRFKIKDLGNGDILFCRPKTLDPRIVRNGIIRGKKFQTLVDAPVYNINKIGPKELFNRFQDFIRLSIEEEFPALVQHIRDEIAQEGLNHTRNNSRGHG